MKTPVYDFVDTYLEKNSLRAHMPGHKGKEFLGVEARDITEISGADVLCESTGILGESQREAARLFQTGETFYSTEGSSLAIKGMLYAAYLKWKKDSVPKNGQSSDGNQKENRPVILAARNIHRAMIDGCGLLDIDVEFIQGTGPQGLCSARVTPEQVEKALEGVQNPMAVYLTSPDYMGIESEISGIAEVCHRHKVLFLVDNAHGAYLAFLKESRHPIALGADMCCDSAHKTLPVLTGGAYLHLSERISPEVSQDVRRGMAFFGSTSPSYLILQSLDICNRYLEEDFPDELERCVRKIGHFKAALEDAGIPIVAGEPLKIVINTGALGYTGEEIGQELREFDADTPEGKRRGIECEYAGEQRVVFMMSPCNEDDDWRMLYQWLAGTRLKHPKPPLPPVAGVCGFLSVRRMSIREAMLAPSQMISVEQAVGRTLAQETVSCPPAIPIAVSGEEITEEMAVLLKQYGITEISVVA